MGRAHVEKLRWNRIEKLSVKFKNAFIGENLQA